MDTLFPLFVNENLEFENFLSGNEAHHASKVMRLCVGEKIQVTDGKGNLVQAIVTDILRNRVNYSVIEHEKCGMSTRCLHLAVAPTKNIERYEFMIEKCTEFGFSRLTPLICEHSERTVVKTERLNRVMLAAAKQSVKTNFPILDEPQKFKSFVESCKEVKHKFIAVCVDIEKVPLIEAIPVEGKAVVMIGPEGDFSIAELELALQHGFVAVSLGQSRLRTETAGIAACHTFYVKQPGL
jgi:16S rRNA (uracil1498-N3)-methyltransferase